MSRENRSFFSCSPGRYGGIAPGSDLALKKLIEVGAGVVDRYYRGEVGVILFNSGNEDFTVNMGDKIAQLHFEKITSPTIKEVDMLKVISRGAQGFGNAGVQSTDDCQATQQRTNQSMMELLQSISKLSSTDTTQNPSKFNEY